MFQNLSVRLPDWTRGAFKAGQLKKEQRITGVRAFVHRIINWCREAFGFVNRDEFEGDDDADHQPTKKPRKSAKSIRQSYLGLGLAGFHKVSYQEWGDLRSVEKQALHPKPPVVCVHGLTRNSHDFDKLAARLCRERQVVCPDVVGRGQSDWIENSALYENLQYNADMNALISRLDVPEVDWIGTSMGGLIGMMLAASAKSPIRKMVINDVGPYITYSSLSKIGNYVGRSPEFADLEEAEDYLRDIHVQFAPMTNKDWRDMARFGVRELENGKLALNYDPKIGDPLRAGLTGFDVNLWPLWEMIKCPVLLFRGENSELLTEETAERMTTTGPCAELIEIKEAGHAPTLNTSKQIDLIKDWLNEG